MLKTNRHAYHGLRADAAAEGVYCFMQQRPPIVTPELSFKSNTPESNTMYSKAKPENRYSVIRGVLWSLWYCSKRLNTF